MNRADLAQRFRLVDTRSGRVYPLDGAMPTQSCHAIPPRNSVTKSSPTQAHDAALAGSRTRTANVDPSNSNFLRGGYGDMTNGNTYRNNGMRGYDEEEFRPSEDPNDMPPRGRPTPASTWAYSNPGSDGNSDLTAEGLAHFVEAAIRSFDEDERATFLSMLSETLDQFDTPLSNGGNGNGSPEEQAGRMRRNNNNGNGNDRRPAQDAALVRRAGGTFHDRFPEAGRVLNAFGR